MQSAKSKNPAGAATQSSKASSILPENNMWVHRYVLSQHWASDLQFFEDELNFFRILIDKHLSLLLDEKNIDRTRTMVSHIQGMEKNRSSLAEKINKHMEHIVALVENPFAQNAQAYKEYHGRLESEFSDFVKHFRSLKQEVFKVAEQVIHSGRLTRLIGAG